MQSDIAVEGHMSSTHAARKAIHLHNEEVGNLPAEVEAYWYKEGPDKAEFKVPGPQGWWPC